MQQYVTMKAAAEGMYIFLLDQLSRYSTNPGKPLDLRGGWEDVLVAAYDLSQHVRGRPGDPAAWKFISQAMRRIAGQPPVDFRYEQGDLAVSSEVALQALLEYLRGSFLKDFGKPQREQLLSDIVININENELKPEIAVSWTQALAEAQKQERNGTWQRLRN